MLTVKYISADGEESVREHFAVVADKTESDGRPRVLVFDDVPQLGHANHCGIYVRQTDGAPGPLMHHGIVYVMNQHGATVATYRL